MNPVLLNVLGGLASITAFTLFLPQALRVWKLRDQPLALEGVSASTQWLVIVNEVFWGVYGLGSQAYWAAAPAAVSLPLAAFVLILLHRSRRSCGTVCGRAIGHLVEACVLEPGHREDCAPLAA